LAILGQKSLDRLKIQIQSKNNTPPFCLKRTKGKQSSKNHRQKVLKSKTTRIIVKCLNISSNNHRRKAKTLMLQISLVLWHQMTDSVPHIDLNLSHFGFLLLKPKIHRRKTFSHLSLQSLKLIIHRLKSSSQLVCKTGADLKKTLQKALHELGPGGNKLILNLETFGNFEHMISNKINFPKDPSVGHCTGSPWMTYS
jgi:hypothetical protein